MSGEAGVGAEHLGGVLGLEFDVVTGVEDAEDDLFDFVRESVIGGEDCVEIAGVQAGGWRSTNT
jgi:hypothetical protein